MTERSRWSRWAGCARFALAMLLLAACQPEPASIPVAPIRVVDIGRVVDAFEDICLGTAPTFRKAPDRFAGHDLTAKRNEGIVYDGSGTVSVRVSTVETTGGPKLRCSIVYEDPNRFIAEERIDAMIRAASGRVRGARRAQFPAADGGVREGRAWSFAIGGRRGDLLDVPYVGRGDLGVLILQFPALR